MDEPRRFGVDADEKLLDGLMLALTGTSREAELVSRLVRDLLRPSGFGAERFDLKSLFDAIGSRGCCRGSSLMGSSACGSTGSRLLVAFFFSVEDLAIGTSCSSD